MSLKVKRAFIAAGGSGSRMRQYIKRKRVSSKSLIRLFGKPIISYIYNETKSLFVEVLITAEKQDTFEKLIEIFKKCENVTVFKNSANGPACYPKTFVSNPFFFMYGHSLVTRQHLTKMAKCFNAENVVVSGFRASSENRPIIAHISKGRVISKRWVSNKYKPKESEVFLEPPFILNSKAARSVSKVNKKGDSKINPVIMATDSKIIKVIPAPFPHEIHYEYEVPLLEQFLIESENMQE